MMPTFHGGLLFCVSQKEIRIVKKKSKAVILLSTEHCNNEIAGANFKYKPQMILAYNACDAAAKAKGKDVSADLECMKYFSPIEKECWACICQIAKAEGWKITGCKARTN